MNRNAHELAFVALGSNLGDSKEIVRRAFDRLQTLSTQPLLALLTLAEHSPRLSAWIAAFCQRSGRTFSARG
jgi:7,8-dihydro-6-hydroxymethylpterin-pyrophosphokinase